MSTNSPLLDYMIVGQGISGTVLSYKLIQAGKSVIVIDDGHKTASTTKAAGIINPITGRSYTKSWKIDQLLPSAINTYGQFSDLLKHNYYLPHTIVRVLTKIVEENKWSSRLLDDSYLDYIEENHNIDSITSAYRESNNCAIIKGGRVRLNALISDYRQWLKEADSLYEDSFKHQLLDINNLHVSYKQFTAKRIIFAEGVQSYYNKYFNHLPFQPVKGEVLILKIPNYKIEEIIKHGIFICPLDDDLYWVGSGYQREYTNDKPTEAGYKKLITQLNDVLKLEYVVVDHIAGIRPSVKDRKPLIGKSKLSDRIYIFGGMGTKGSSLVPYWADHLIDHLENHTKIDDEVNITRF